MKFNPKNEKSVVALVDSLIELSVNNGDIEEDNHSATSYINDCVRVYAESQMLDDWIGCPVDEVVDNLTYIDETHSVEFI